MNRAWRDRARKPTPALSSRSDWRALLKLARDCCEDARDEDRSADAEFRLMTLSRRVGLASSKTLEREGGSTIGDTARGFIRLAGAFARPTTSSRTRLAMVPVVDATAGFLDDQLHELNTNEFQRAHEGRPEVMG